MQSLLLLDRDGVINADSPDYIRSPESWQPLPGSLEAIARLHRAGFRILVATNQSGIARGLFTVEDLAAIHARMERAVEAAGGAIAEIAFCPHGPDDGCDCRKPAPGLLTGLLERHGPHQDAPVFVGDSMRDLEAALAADCQPWLVRTGNGVATEARLPATMAAAVRIFDDLGAAADALLTEAAA